MFFFIYNIYTKRFHEGIIISDFKGWRWEITSKEMYETKKKTILKNSRTVKIFECIRQNVGITTEEIKKKTKFDNLKMKFYLGFLESIGVIKVYEPKILDAGEMIMNHDIESEDREDVDFTSHVYIVNQDSIERKIDKLVSLSEFYSYTWKIDQKKQYLIKDEGITVTYHLSTGDKTIVRDDRVIYKLMEKFPKISTREILRKSQIDFGKFHLCINILLRSGVIRYIEPKRLDGNNIRLDFC